MKGRSGILIIIVVVIGLLVIGGGISYNGFVKNEEQVNSAWSQVENQYQRRYDLIPNLVNTVKGYAKQEEKVLTEVTEARARISQITVTPEVLNDTVAFRKFEQAQGELTGALKSLLSVTEAYPDLKSNQNFLALQAELAGTENRIAVERMRFNEVVQQYNVQVRHFPGSIFAGIFGFHAKAYFKGAEGSQNAPRVEF